MGGSELSWTVANPKHAFAIRNEADFLEKLRQEFRDLECSPDSSRHAINFAMTAWHLTDWVWGLQLKANWERQRQLFGTIFRGGIDEFRAGVVKECEELGIMQEICNGSKHLGSDPKADIADTFRAAPINIKIGEGSDAKVSKGENRVWVTNQKGGTVVFVDLAEKVLRFWESKI